VACLAITHQLRSRLSDARSDVTERLVRFLSIVCVVISLMVRPWADLVDDLAGRVGAVKRGPSGPAESGPKGATLTDHARTATRTPEALPTTFGQDSATLTLRVPEVPTVVARLEPALLAPVQMLGDVRKRHTERPCDLSSP